MATAAASGGRAVAMAVAAAVAVVFAMSRPLDLHTAMQIHAEWFHMSSSGEFQVLLCGSISAIDVLKGPTLLHQAPSNYACQLWTHNRLICLATIIA